MSKRCSVLNCHSNSGKRDPKISVYCLPRDKEIRQKWISVIPIKSSKISKSTRICTLHFTDCDFYKEGRTSKSKSEKKKLKLRKDAVPSIFPDLPSCSFRKGIKRGSLEQQRIRIKSEQLNQVLKERIDDGEAQNVNVPMPFVPVTPTDMFGHINCVSVPSASWTNNEISALIALYQSEKCLYDTNNAKYYDINERNEAYQRIQTILKKIRPDCTIPEIENGIFSLHNQYIAEKKKQNQNIRAGLITEDTYEPDMWCFGLMQFLDDHITLTEIKAEPIEYDDYQSTIPVSNSIVISDIKTEVPDVDCELGQDLDLNHVNIECRTENMSLEEDCQTKNDQGCQTEDINVNLEESCRLNKVHKSCQTENLNSNESSLCRKENRITKPTNESSVFKRVDSTLSPNQDRGAMEDALGRFIASEMRSFRENRAVYYEARHKFMKALENANLGLHTEEDNGTQEPSNKSFVSKKVNSAVNPDQDPGAREDALGRFIACEMRSLRNNPEMYSETKRELLKALMDANFKF